MKKTKTFALLFLVLVMISCSSSKKAPTVMLFNTTWELEYLSGPRIAFEGLYPDSKPKITFDSNGNRVEGTTSCNGYSADFILNGNKISFGEPAPSTMMYCGEGETFFLNTIKNVDSYKIDSVGKLNLLVDDITMMRFKKIPKQ